MNSKQLEAWLDSLDFEPPRKPYCKGKADKVRDSIREQIKSLKQQEDEKLPTKPS